MQVQTPLYRLVRRNLVKARIAAGYTQRAAARAVKWPQSRLARIESGERRIDVVELLILGRLYKRTRLNWYVEE
jgi:transcriptional regulator with XRE-family HTH domain